MSGRDRIVVSTLRWGRSNPGSNPGHGRTFNSADSPVQREVLDQDPLDISSDLLKVSTLAAPVEDSGADIKDDTIQSIRGLWV